MDDVRDYIGQLGEFALIERLSRLLGPQNVAVGIGDDAAVFEQAGPNSLLATIDMQVDEVHFRKERIRPFDLGRRALAVNISDIAAMGGEPTAALISLALPTATTVEYVEDLYRGISALAAEFGVAVAGGNMTRTSGPLSVDIVVMGSVPKSEIILRSGARVGDILAVSGTVGVADAARRVMDRPEGIPRGREWDWVTHAQVPVPRVRIARGLAAEHIVTAMLDVSDGLAADLHQLCRASHVGALVSSRDVVPDVRVTRAAELLDLNPMDLCLFGGEDYELLVTLPQERVERAQQIAGDTGLCKIGSVVPANLGVRQISPAEGLRPLEALGWRHF